jgi:hypothetical protein
VDAAGVAAALTTPIDLSARGPISVGNLGQGAGFRDGAAVLSFDESYRNYQLTYYIFGNADIIVDVDTVLCASLMFVGNAPGSMLLALRGTEGTVLAQLEE